MDLDKRILISVRNFRKSFGEKVVHDGVSFDLFEGECLGLIGGSGTGKSVLLRSLIGLEMPDTGEVLIFEEDFAQKREEDFQAVRKQIAYAFQGGALFDSMSVYDNLAFPLREHTDLNEDEIGRRIQKQLSQVGLENQGSLMPSQLSGGMQKRVGLARALLSNPQIILFDEPTAGLDPYNTLRIQDLISATKRNGLTSVLVTHDMPVARAVCDRIAILSKGKIAVIGTVEELSRHSDDNLSKFAAGEFL